MQAGQANTDHIATLRFMPEIGKLVHEIPGTILVRRKHADAFNADGQQDEFENNEARDNQNGNAHQCYLGIVSDHRDAHPPVQSRLLRAGIRLFHLIVCHHAIKFHASCQRRKRRLLRWHLFGRVLVPPPFSPSPPTELGERVGVRWRVKFKSPRPGPLPARRGEGVVVFLVRGT